jgi:hypothetical protein
VDQTTRNDLSNRWGNTQGDVAFYERRSCKNGIREGIADYLAGTRDGAD